MTTPEQQPSAVEQYNTDLGRRLREAGVGQRPRCCCRKHEAEDLKGSIFGRHFIVCPTCQDKRCPRAEDCANACQQPAQPGSGEIKPLPVGLLTNLRCMCGNENCANIGAVTEHIDRLQSSLTAAQQRIAALQSENTDLRNRLNHSERLQGRYPRDAV